MSILKEIRDNLKPVSVVEKNERFKKVGDCWLDKETNLLWSSTLPKEMTWQKAIDACKNLDFNGHKDWRLPTVKELISLVDYEKYDPATEIPNTESNFYWSSTTFADFTDGAWYVGFNYGNVYNRGKANAFYVRAVRGGQ